MDRGSTKRGKFHPTFNTLQGIPGWTIELLDEHANRFDARSDAHEDPFSLDTFGISRIFLFKKIHLLFLILLI